MYFDEGALLCRCLRLSGSGNTGNVSLGMSVSLAKLRVEPFEAERKIIPENPTIGMTNSDI